MRRHQKKKKQYRHNKKALKCEKKPEKEKGIGIRNMFEKLKKTSKKQTSIAIIKIFLKCEKTLKKQNKTKQKQKNNPKSIAVIKIL